MGKGMRSRSFRDEDYNTRRVFLRSYPLQWGVEERGDVAEAAKEVGTRRNGIGKKHMKKMILAAIHWSGGKVLVLRKVKDKICIFVVACVPIRFKPPTALISA